MKRLTPLKGMDNVSHDDKMSSFGKEGFVALRDAVNVDIDASGRTQLRRTGSMVTDNKYQNLWQSSLHGDVFATLGPDLVRVNVSDWSHEILGDIGSDTATVEYLIINNLIYISNGVEIFTFDGQSLNKLTIDSPAAPVLRLGIGELDQGTYTVALSWVASGKESALSGSVSIDVANDQGINLLLPYCFEASVDSVVVYCTTRDGGELRKLITLPIAQREVSITNLADLGRAAQFANLSSLPGGKFTGYWQGRLVTANRNIIRFSQAMNFHLHDERYDYVAMPQRITFMMPTDSGIWVGQVDHVAFLSGSEPSSLQMVRKTAQAPVPFSAIYSDSEDLGEIAQGGQVVVWLSQHGYVVGSPLGQLIEPHANRLKGISAKVGQSVRFAQRVITISK